jgi:(p)ppGpp synthase/HD superfamily hydrolase
MSVKINRVVELRPRMDEEFNPGPFKARTPAIEEAYQWGKSLHAGQLRLSGEPYFETHCAWVAGFLDNLVHNEAWTIAALLHDAVEDQGESLDMIMNKFPGPLGVEVAHIVDGVTKISNPRDGRSRELETLQKIAQFRDPGVFLVKLADKSHNLLTLAHMPVHKQRAKAVEAIRAYGKLAGILNCYRWRRWIEDMAFPFADPETFAFVKNKIDADPRLDTNFLNHLMTELGLIMEKNNFSGSVEIIVNGYWQSWQKLRRMAQARKTSMNSFRDINDLVSIRLVLDENTETDCYRLLPLINRYLASYLDQNRFDDYISVPQNGYRALQVTAWLPDHGAVEIAIATRVMEEENHWGVVYALQQHQDISQYNPIEILTPSGGARFLPEGSTVLDAVASIQQEFLLDKISAVKVNGTNRALYETVHPGDIVEVITEGKRLVPSEEWLKYANASTTRTIRSVINTEALKKAAEEGRQIIRPILAEHGLIALEDVLALNHDQYDQLLEQLGAASLEDLYVSLGSGAIRSQDISTALTNTDLIADQLKWTTISLVGTRESNQPGALARLANLVYQAGGNILRSVNNTLADGSFYLRIVVKDLSIERKENLRLAILECGLQFDSLDVV